ncbi:MAG: UDP-N-acetylmuramate--L-alanine ligase [Candidatus Cloacimonetes bacterium]|nr:UDP-N-acetylmuramate--L-alanine ligase [Candidatus Cloacimonadota bacterium]MBL7086289.1 UDP-N-acetylmuramate--L-alanine ligase [Candidatus Cloacimonadota bacterium]
MLGKTKKLHFVGIGGNGMSGIAELLLNYGYKITGSDLAKTPVTEKLERMGGKIFYSHKARHISDVDVVVKSSAIQDDNIEIKTALERKIPVIRRAEMLSELMRMKYGISVAGTHGKTTTTSMVGMILTEANLQPTLIIGGVVRNFDSNAVLGNSNYIVVEADEYDRSFLTLKPIIASITNIEEEHTDCYTTINELENAFLQYANSVPFFGLIVACIDDKIIRKITASFEKRLCTYGLAPRADVRAVNIKFKNFTSQYDLVYKSKKLGSIKLQLPGIHNIQNSLLAATIALELNIPFIDIHNGLEKFKGVYRRFEKKGFVRDILIYDDYAHHPTEIKATLSGIKKGTFRRIITVFQPHLYSRTKIFYKEFAESLSLSDLLIITDVYPAREKPIKNVSGKLISDYVFKTGNKNILYVKNKQDVPNKLLEISKEGDIVITMGAGDVYKISDEFISLLKKQVV